jgi:hypothetical protein
LLGLVVIAASLYIANGFAPPSTTPPAELVE